MYALIIESHEARSGASGNPIMTEKGDKFLVLDEPEGWVEATSQHYDSLRNLPRDLKTFKTRSSAEDFARRWEGHPWWCKPNGRFEVIEVTPETKLVITGYRRL